MNNFKNKRILLFAPELEKAEYRGIAFYTKSLVKSLSSLGAEIWLVSSFNPYKLKIKEFNESSRNYICNYEILQKFYNGSSTFFNNKEFFTKNRVLNFLISYINKSKFVIYFLNTWKVFLRNRSKCLSEGVAFIAYVNRTHCIVDAQQPTFESILIRHF